MIALYLERSSKSFLAIYAMVAAFGTYFCMYAFRKPFTVGAYDGLSFWGIDYKILLIITQVLGYMLSKFIGIKVIAELGRQRRALYLVLLIGIAELALLGFALVPYPYNFIFLFLNGLPLGMIWGIVFSYLEGRTYSEMLGAGLSASFIVSSGAVKSVGKVVMVNWQVSEWWMPVVTGGLFFLPLLLFTYLLDQIPPPTAEDIALRTQREPMSARERSAFLQEFAVGLAALVFFYMLLTAYRDFRDNFAAELWSALGYGDAPAIFTIAEIPIAVMVLIMLGLTMLVRNNQKAFMIYHALIIFTILLIGGSTLLFQLGYLNPAAWMILVGLGLYLSYVPFNCILFDRMIAAFRYIGNAGFLIYVADSFGYLGSVAILFYKNFGQPDMNWLDFFISISYGLAALGLLAMLLASGYFYQRVQRLAHSDGQASA